jgi:hypothetical protein
MPSDNFLAGNPLSLERIRSVLVRLEDTITFNLIERAQFAHNPRIYQRGAFKELEDLGFQGSWLEWFLRETEIFHGMLSTSQTLQADRSWVISESQSTPIHQVTSMFNLT